MDKINIQRWNVICPVTVLQVPTYSLRSVEADASSKISVFLSYTIIIINDFIRNVNPYGTWIYADNTSLLVKRRGKKTLEAKGKNAITDSKTWFTVNKHILKIPKCREYQ